MNRTTKAYARLYEAARGNQDDEKKFWLDVDNDFKKHNVHQRDFSIRGLFETFVCDSTGDPCGRELIESWTPDGGESMTHLSEAGIGAVTTAAFSKITGQIVYNEVLDAWQNPAFIAPLLVNTVSTSFLEGEKIPGISVVGDDAEAVGEAQPYPLTGITQSYVEMPRPVKRGHILPLTRETIIADRTNVLLDRAQSIGMTMGINKEKRVVDLVIGVTQTWKRNGSSALATYSNSTGQHSFDNKITNALVDYTDIDTALQAFDGFTDPDTGEPIVTQTNQIIVPSSLLYTARRVVNATEVRLGDGTTAPTILGPNPLNSPSFGGAQAASPFQILTSPYVQLRMTAASTTANTWWIGNFKRAFRYMEIWPMSVMTMPANSEWEFTHDIVRAWKVSEFGVGGVVEPRHVIQCDPS